MDALSLVARLTLDSSGYNDGLDDASGKAQTFGQKLKTGLASAGKIAVGAITAATGAVTAFAGASVKTGAEFDSSMSQVAATLGYTMSDIENNVDGAGDAFDALRAKAREMGGSTIYSASEAAEGLNILAMSGYDAEQSMAMIEDVLHLAAAGSMDMAAAAGYVSGAMKGFNDETKDSGYYADLMAKGATLANTSVSELGEAMSSGAAGAAAYGQSADSMTVALLRLAEQGESGAAAGTALSAAMKNLFTPTDQAKQALDELGVSAYNADGSARDFNDVVNDLDASLQGMTAEEANAYKQTIFGIQGLDAYNKMVVTGTDKQEEWAAALATASNGAGEAAKQYDTMTDNLEGAIAGWESALSDMQIEISDQLTPTLSRFINFGTDGLQRLTAAFQTGGLSGAMSELGDVLSEGLGMVVEILPEAIEAGAQLLSALITGMIENLPMLVEAALSIITTLADELVENLPALIPAIVDVILQIVNTLTDPANLTALIEAAIAIIMGIGNGLIAALPQLIALAPTIVSNLVTALIQNLPLLIDSGIQMIVMLVQAIGTAIPQLLQAGLEIVSTVAEGIVNAFGTLVAKGVEIVQKVKEGFSSAVANARQWGSDLINNFVSGIKEKWANLKSAVSDTASTIRSLLHFSEPDEGPLSDFHTYAPDMMKTFAQGIKDNENVVRAQIERSFDFGDVGTISGTPTVGTSSDSGILTVMQDMVSAIQGMGIYMDTGTLVGQVSPGVDENMGGRYNFAQRGLAV